LSQFFREKQTICDLRLTYEHWSWILVKFLPVILWGFHVVIGSNQRIGEFNRRIWASNQRIEKRCQAPCEEFT